jgi:hypothetical protein
MGIDASFDILQGVAQTAEVWDCLTDRVAPPQHMAVKLYNCCKATSTKLA